MATLEERVAALEVRVDKMDMDLRKHFDDQSLFISSALTGVEERLENRLGARIDVIKDHDTPRRRTITVHSVADLISAFPVARP